MGIPLQFYPKTGLSMSAKSRVVNAHVLAISLIALSPAWARAQTITINNTSLDPIPLSGSVTVDSNGQLSATCAGATCSNLGQATGNPASVSLPEGPIQTTQGAATNVAMAVTNSPVACIGTAIPSTGVTSWIGNDLRTTSGNASVSFSNVGTYALTANCYNADGSAGADTVSVEVASGGGGGNTPDPNTCTIDGQTITGTTRPTGYEFIRPSGFTMFNREWENQFNGRAWGAQISYLAPIGSFSVGDAQAAGMYITIPFKPTAGVIYTLEWFEAQSVTAANYFNPRRSTSVSVSISPCAGDVRPRVSTSTNQWLKGCKKQSSQSNLGFSTLSGSACRLNADEWYWLTIQMADGTDGTLTPTEHTCADGRTQCEANFDLNF